MTQSPQVLGLPPDFDLSQAEAEALRVDEVVASATLELGIFGCQSPLGEASRRAETADQSIAACAFQLLLTVAAFGFSDEPRAPFGRMASGTFGDGSPWQTALPDDLSDAHTRALAMMLPTIKKPVLRGRVADVLWHRARPRNPELARIAIDSYLNVATETFDPDNWTTSQQHLARAFDLATTLGKTSAERKKVVAAGHKFLNRLKGNDRLYYTQRIVDMILNATTDSGEIEDLLSLTNSIATESTDILDFNRARAYLDASIKAAVRLQDVSRIKDLRLLRAETYASEALSRPTEMLRTMDLRTAQLELRNAGATRERLGEIASLLDESQALAVHEMVPVGTTFSSESLAENTRALLRGRAPIQALWLLATPVAIPKRQNLATQAEQMLSKYVFAFSIGRSHLTRDGRKDGETPGAIGASDDQRASALLGAMRDQAARGRILAAYGIIEPGREELTLQHNYTLSEIFEAVRSRPFVPVGHANLWAKGIHSGLVGEYDLALHILVPQMEHALREALRKRGEPVYTTAPSGVQSLMSLEKVLEHQVTLAIFGEDIVFTLQAALGERLGANMRNIVAHGILNDAESASHEAAYVWWLALHILRFYGTDAAGPPEKSETTQGGVK